MTAQFSVSFFIRLVIDIFITVNMNEDCLYCNSYRNNVVVVVVFETCKVQSIIVTEVSD